MRLMTLSGIVGALAVHGILLAGQDNRDFHRRFYSLGDIRLESGVVLPNARIAYARRWLERFAPEVAERFVDVTVSLDGHSRELYRQVRGVDGLPALTRGVKAFRALAPEGRLVVIGFAGGAIPRLAMNRVLFRNIDVVGAAWGAFLERHPELRAATHAELLRMVDAGFVAPVVGAEGFGVFRL